MLDTQVSNGNKGGSRGAMGAPFVLLQFWRDSRTQHLLDSHPLLRIGAPRYAPARLGTQGGEAGQWKIHRDVHQHLVLRHGVFPPPVLVRRLRHLLHPVFAGWERGSDRRVNKAPHRAGEQVSR